MKIDNLKAEMKIQSSAENVWQVVGREFAEIERWSSGINQSRGVTEGEVHEGCDLSGRYCDTVQEELTYYSDEEMRFSYMMVGPPFFLKKIGNNWSVKEIGLNESLVEFRPEIEFNAIFGLILVPLFKLGGPWMAKRVLEELKHYVEHGEPHPRKQKALNKL